MVPALAAIVILGRMFCAADTPAAAALLQQDDEHTHTVRAGETLIGIATFFEIALDDLMAANGITDPDTLTIGQVLIIPGRSSSPADAEPPQADERTVPETEPFEPEADVGTPADAITIEPTPEANTNTTIERADAALTTSLNTSYRIQPGDTVPYIALINGVDEVALRRLNRLGAEPKLVAGHTLLLPASDDELEASLPVEHYTVGAGDTLGGIALEHGVPLPLLMEAKLSSQPGCRFDRTATDHPSAFGR